jgi:hypothetical protein
MKNLTILHAILNPSKGDIPQVLKDQYEWRKTKQFTGNSWIVVAETLEPIWWNRPLKPETLLQQEPDGLWSLNLPYIGGQADYKTGYNLLLNKNSISIGVHLKLNPNWTAEKIKSIKQMVTNIVYETLLELGVKAENLQFKHNDLLYNGKKFMGNEQWIENGVFTEDTVITLEYTPEEEIFKRLTGKYALARGITGIIEETQCFTKQQFLEKLIEKLTAFANTLN